MAAVPAFANPCVDDHAFAEANGCEDLFGPATSDTVTAGVSVSHRAWLLRIDPADAEAFRAGETVRIVSLPLRVI